jgi:hypothetical protein
VSNVPAGTGPRNTCPGPCSQKIEWPPFLHEGKAKLRLKNPYQINGTVELGNGRLGTRESPVAHFPTADINSRGTHSRPGFHIFAESGMTGLHTTTFQENNRIVGRPVPNGLAFCLAHLPPL